MFFKEIFAIAEKMFFLKTSSPSEGLEEPLQSFRSYQ